MADETAARLAHLCKLLGYGHLVVEVAGGEPKVVRVVPCIRLDKPLNDGITQILTQIAVESITN